MPMPRTYAATYLLCFYDEATDACRRIEVDADTLAEATAAAYETLAQSTGPDGRDWTPEMVASAQLDIEDICVLK